MHSEHDEEKYILEAVSDIPPAEGVFIDVGAYDGVTYSNTRALVELGWSGVMIEPGLTAFQKLLENYPDDKITLVHAALESIEAPRVELFRNNPETYSTATRQNFERFKNHVPFSRPYWVATISWADLSLDWLLCNAQVVSIDTEGSSAQLLEEFPFEYSPSLHSGNKPRPRVICVEHDEQFDRCAQAVEPFGYHEIHRNKVNVIYRLP